MAYDAIKQHQHSLMTAMVEGKFAMVQIPDPKLGPRKVDVDTMFNTDRLPPHL